MEQVMETLQGISLDSIVQSSEPAATSLQRSQSTKPLLAAMLWLAEARCASLSKAQLQTYVAELRAFDLRDVQAAVRQLGLEQRGEFEQMFPQLGTVMARVRAARDARMQPPRCEACSVCEGRRIVVVERDGGRVARDCQCIVTWRQLKAQHEAEQAGSLPIGGVGQISTASTS